MYPRVLAGLSDATHFQNGYQLTAIGYLLKHFGSRFVAVSC